MMLDTGAVARYFALHPRDTRSNLLARSASLTRKGWNLMRESYIAIVDDEESVCKAMGRLLRSAGFSVATYPSGRQLVDALPERLPDCIIIDLHMPGMTGLDTQTTLATADVEVPLIFISASDDSEARQNALTAGAVAFLHKPVAEDKLLTAIATALGNPSTG